MDEFNKVFGRGELFEKIILSEVNAVRMVYDIKMICPICNQKHVWSFQKSIDRDDESKKYSIDCCLAEFFDKHVLRCAR